jgi:hypothetical protein
MRAPPIRICSTCQNRTHKRFWMESKCPVCRDTSYIESTTGGLSTHQIIKVRQNYLREIKELEVNAPSISVERE